MRRTPIRRRSPLEAGRRPRRKVGRWDGWRAQEGREVRRRLRCELCGRTGVDPHHPFGRAAEPWASSRLVVVLVCRECHEQVTGRVGRGLAVDLRANLRVIAVRRMAAHLGAADILADNENAPMTYVFELLRARAGILAVEPPGFTRHRR